MQMYAHAACTCLQICIYRINDLYNKPTGKTAYIDVVITVLLVQFCNVYSVSRSVTIINCKDSLGKHFIAALQCK